MNAREFALKVIYDVEYNDSYVNIALNKAFLEYNILDKDKGLATEIVYGVIKNKLYLDYVISCFSKIKKNKISKYVLNILRIGIYQILFLDKIPDSAACNECVSLAKKYSNKGGYGFVNGVLRSVVRQKDEIILPDKEKDTINYYSIKYSFPVWIVSKLIDEYGESKAESFMEESNRPHGIDIRINTLKTNTDEFKKFLEENNIKYKNSSLAKNIISLNADTALTSYEEYKNGLFSMQNASSNLAVEVLNPLPGEFVIDICAAPGGKSCAMAELMQNQGKILSFDLYEHKIKLILNSAKRLGIEIINAAVFDACQLNENLINKVDKVLVDAPCSGIGVVHKKPDIKYKRQEEDILTLSEIQSTILLNASKYVKPGGKIVYSTCTIFKEENENVVNKFLNSNKNFMLVYKKQILTTTEGESGFFIAKLVKNVSEETNG